VSTTEQIYHAVIIVKVVVLKWLHHTRSIIVNSNGQCAGT